MPELFDKRGGFRKLHTLSRAPARRPRILFLADRNILANQAFSAFSAFPEDALVRIAPDEIKKKGQVPKNGSRFFTIFQTFMSAPVGTPWFGDYPPDFIDECHRGGANEESNWRGILEHFAPAVQVGVEELDPEKLQRLLRLKYHNSIADAVADLGQPGEIGKAFAGFQKYLYQQVA